MGLLDKVNGLLEASIDRRITELKKAEPEGEPLVKRQNEEGKLERKGLIYDPWTQELVSGGVFKQRRGYLNNNILKTVARRDSIVATIINVRAQQVQGFCRPQQNRFDVGFKINPIGEEQDDAEIKRIEDFIVNCGQKNDRSDEDKLDFDQFGYMITQDWLKYGHCSVEKVPTASNDHLHHFFPLAAETIYYANKNIGADQIKKLRDSWRKVIDRKEESKIVEKVARGEYDYVQLVEGRVLEAFTAKELIFSRLYLETDIDLNGYCIGPLERALNAITGHLKIENHQQSFFTNGFASRGLLVIQGDCTPNQLRTLQAQWTQQVTGGMNAWRTPILAGIKGVQWVPLSAANRDMEYAAYQDHILRTIHAVFNIDPEETGFGYLSRGTEQKALSESSNEWKVTKSIDKGLRPILSRLETMINEDILPAWDSELSRKYRFCFVGLDAETRGEELARIKEEVQIHTSINEARAQASMDPLQIGGGLILNPLLLQTLQGNMSKGMFMELFMGVEGASQRPDLQYIPDPLWFQFQQFQLGLMSQAAGAQAAGGGKDKSPGKNPGGKDGGGDEKAQEQAQKEAEAQAQAMAMAVQQYVSSNPELFKSVRAELAKSGHAKAGDEFSSMMADALGDEYAKAAKKLHDQVMEALEADGGSEEEKDS